MIINKQVQERLLEVITSSNLNKSRFANSLGIQPSVLSDIFSGKAKTFN